MKINTIKTSNAPEAVGPYSQAVNTGTLIFCAGQLALKPDGASLLDRPAAEQARQVLQNVSAVLEAAGSSLSKVVKATVFLTDLNDFQAMNKVYGEFFKEPYPARSTIQVAALPKGARVEIEVIALS